MTPPKALIAGNWKMNGLRAQAQELQHLIAELHRSPQRCDVMICPPATLLAHFAACASDSPVQIGAQDCHPRPSGAHTGDISAEMLADSGASAVIVGHSERRADHGETDAMVQEKALAAMRAGLTAIICVGETETQRREGHALNVVGAQLAGSVPAQLPAENVVVAYEPVWAIGTGLTPTVEDIREMHGFMREQLRSMFDSQAEQIRLLYGGSVKPANAQTLLAIDNVDGALVGGASLRVADFFPIIQARG